MIELWKLHVVLVIGNGESFRLFLANDPGNVPERVLLLSQKVVKIAPKSGDGQAEKPIFDGPPHTGAKNRYDASLTNQCRRRSRNFNMNFWCVAFWRSNQAVYRFLASPQSSKFLDLSLSTSYSPSPAVERHTPKRCKPMTMTTFIMNQNMWDRPNRYHTTREAAHFVIEC